MSTALGNNVNAADYYLGRHVAGGHASARALVTTDQELTYGELHERVRQAQGALADIGVGRGDRVLIVLADCPLAVVFLFGALGMGAVPVPISPHLDEPTYEFVCADCTPSAAVTSGEHIDALVRIRARIGAPCVVVAADSCPSGPGVCSATDAMRASEPKEAARVSPDDIALLQYTSGSTGRPKGVAHLHRGLLALPEGIGRHLSLSHGDLCYSAAKMFFGYGMGNSVFLPMAAGATTFLRAKASDPLGTLEAIHEIKPTVFFAGPTLYGAIAAIRDAEKTYDLSSVRLCVSAGDTLEAGLFTRWRNKFGHDILDGLGSTECLHIFIAGAPAELEAGYLGRAIAPYETRLLNDDGSRTPDGSPGNLEVRGPASGITYWNRPERLRDQDEWIRTGDLLINTPEHGFCYAGRTDDVFKVRELKVSPLEVEQRLNAHPAVVESAVVGRRDLNGLTIVCAVVCIDKSRHSDDALASELKASLRSSLPAYKVPRYLEFVEMLPRTNSGKLSRAPLRTWPVGSEVSKCADRSPARTAAI